MKEGDFELSLDDDVLINSSLLVSDKCDELEQTDWPSRIRQIVESSFTRDLVRECGHLAEEAFEEIKDYNPIFTDMEQKDRESCESRIELSIIDCLENVSMEEEIYYIGLIVGGG
jgi:hypothetical protein